MFRKILEKVRALHDRRPLKTVLNFACVLNWHGRFLDTKQPVNVKGNAAVLEDTLRFDRESFTRRWERNYGDVNGRESNRNVWQRRSTKGEDLRRSW